MLQILRKKAQSTFIQIIVVIIALVFIFWGVGTNMSGDRQAALTVNGDEISFQEFQQAYDRAYQRFSDQFGGNVPKGLAETFGIKQQVINQLIQTTLLRQGAKEMGIHVSGQEISQVIQEMIQFQENGSFNMDKYKSILTANRMAPTKFENSMRFDRISEVAAREVGNFSATTTDFEIEELYGKLNEKVEVEFVKLSPDTFKESVQVEEQLLADWFETVKENYKTDTQIKLKYIPFTFDSVAKKIEIDEPAIEAYYQENLSQYLVPEKRRARHILFKAEEDDSEETHAKQSQRAEEILDKALNGVEFADLAKTYSEGPSQSSGGDLGFFSEGQMVPTFNDAVFALQVNEISNVVKTRFGYHIIRLEEIREPSTQSLADVSAQIREKLQSKKAENLAFQVANSAYESIIGAGSLVKFSELNPENVIKSTEFFAKSDAPEELRKDTQFLNEAFQLKKGELSSLIKGQTGYAIFFADNIKEPVVPELTVIKDKVKDDYLNSKSIDMAEQKAQDMLAKLNEGQSLETLATENDGVVKTSGLLSKNEPANKSDFPSSLVDSCFLLSPSSPLPETPGRQGNDFYVFSFLKREIPTLNENPEEREKYSENLLRFKEQQLLAAWLRNLEINAEISQHQNL